MPRTSSCLLLALVLAGPLLLLPPPLAAQPAAASADAQAVQALTRMGTALRALPHFTLNATTSTEYVLDDGQKIALPGTVAYRVLGPDHFFVEIQSEDQHRQLFYDGKALTIYSPRLK